MRRWKTQFSFLFQQLHSFRGKPVRGRMNPRSKECFPSADHQAPTLHQGNPQTAPGWGTSGPGQPACHRAVPQVPRRARQGLLRKGLGEYILHISKRKPGTWYLILESNHGLNCILLQSCLNIKGKSTGIVQHQD